MIAVPKRHGYPSHKRASPANAQEVAHQGQQNAEWATNFGNAPFARQPDGDTKRLAKILIPKFGSLAAILRAFVEWLADQHGPNNASTSALKLGEVAGLHLAHSNINDCPSDETTLSQADTTITNETDRTLRLMTIDLHDNLIVAGTQCISFKSLSHLQAESHASICHWT